jgi:hypothetical protein
MAQRVFRCSRNFKHCLTLATRVYFCGGREGETVRRDELSLQPQRSPSTHFATELLNSSIRQYLRINGVQLAS